MSGQSLIMFFSILAIALAANKASDTSWTPNQRGPASLAGKKELGMVNKEILKRTHKLRGPLAVAVELVGAPPERAGDVFVLKGAIASESALNNVEFTWTVPEGVEVINGQTSSVIAVLSEGRPFETQITLRQLDDANARISLKARGREDDMGFSDTAQYNTMDQVKIEASRKELMKSTEEYVQEEKRLKIFH